MDWFKNRLTKPSYKRLALHEHDSETDLTNKLHIRHGFLIGLTVINLILTTLSITGVILLRNRQILPTHDHQSCHCPTAPIDPRYKNQEMNVDLKRIAGYSPLFDEVDLTPQPKVLNGAFHDNTTIFMQDPSPEVDAAWEMFSEDVFLTSWPTVRESGRSLSKSIHFPPATDGEPGKYIATFDVFHQIHCLNWLRKSVNWEYYYGDHKPGPVYLMHQKHCIHMLLQVLMCSADVDMVTFEWMEGHDERVNNPKVGKEDGAETDTIHTRVNQDAIPAANFNVHKMCRNFSALVEWAKKNKEVDPAETRRRLIVPENTQLNRAEDY